jgi:hypothetical protein
MNTVLGRKACSETDSESWSNTNLGQAPEKSRPTTPDSVGPLSYDRAGLVAQKQINSTRNPHPHHLLSNHNKRGPRKTSEHKRKRRILVVTHTTRHSSFRGESD